MEVLYINEKDLTEVKSVFNKLNSSLDIVKKNH